MQRTSRIIRQKPSEPGKRDIRADLASQRRRADLEQHFAIIDPARHAQVVGQPLCSGQVLDLPGMQMGERPETASPVAGQSGVYRARASFPMGGAYQVTVTVSGPHGTAKGRSCSTPNSTHP